MWLNSVSGLGELTLVIEVWDKWTNAAGTGTRQRLRYVKWFARGEVSAQLQARHFPCY
jgi:hypothetical protein